MVKFVDSELRTIRQEVDNMWQLVQEQLKNAARAVLTGDKELALQVVNREKRVNAFELHLDSDIEEFIARYNPVAVDLRFALTMLQVSNNLERIGDYAGSMAFFTRRNELDGDKNALLAELRVEEMVDHVCSMLAAAHCSLLDRDIEQAKDVVGMDDQVDQIARLSTKTLSDYALEHPYDLRFCFELTNVVRKLERAGDHITNLAEAITFYLDAEVLKHHD